MKPLFGKKQCGQGSRPLLRRQRRVLPRFDRICVSQEDAPLFWRGIGITAEDAWMALRDEFRQADAPQELQLRVEREIPHAADASRSSELPELLTSLLQFVQERLHALRGEQLTAHPPGLAVDAHGERVRELDARIRLLDAIRTVAASCT